MSSLEKLGQDINRIIAQHLSTDRAPHNYERTGNRRIPEYCEFINAGSNLIAFASTSRALRSFLLPDVFRCLLLGGDKATGDVWHQRLRQLEDSPILPYVLHLEFSSCQKMTNLRIFTHSGLSVLPTAIAKTFSSLHQLDHFFIEFFGVETLPLLNIRPLRYLAISEGLESELPGELVLPHAPISVAPESRIKNSILLRDSTFEERQNALIKALVPILMRSRDTLVGLEIFLIAGWIELVVKELNTSYGIKNLELPALERIEIITDSKVKAFQHLLKTSKVLSHLGIICFARIPLGNPPCKLENLKSLRYLYDDNLDTTGSIRSYLTSAPNLDDLMINGIQQTDLTKLFAPGIRSAGLKTLEIVFQTPGGTLTLQQFEMIVESCAQLENFRVISFSWATHMPLYIKAMSRSLPNLRCFNFDHPWTKARDSLWPGSDGQTIRSEALGHFRIISVVEKGNTIAKEIEHRIQEDIDAVRPAYVKRMLAFAKACPNLVWVRFVATPEVNWTWEFSREGGVLKIDREEAVIRYKPKAGESVPPASGGVFMRESD